MKNTAPKLTLAKIFVWGAAERNILGESYNHASLSLYTGRDESAYLALSFQRHLLTGQLAATGEREPYYAFDFGEPWCPFYAPTVTTKFDAEYSGPNRMRRGAAFIDRVLKRIRAYNLHTIGACQLAQWKVALEHMKLDVELELGLPGRSNLAIRDLPEAQQSPGRRYLQALANGQVSHG